MNSMELYQEEHRKALIDLNAGIGEMSTKLDRLIDMYVKPPTELEVKGSVEVNTQKEVEVTNLKELSDDIKSLQQTLAYAIADNSYEPLEAITVKNIKDAIPETIKINNLQELKDYFVGLKKAIEANQPIVNVAKQEVVFPTDPKRPIAVRLSDGKKFYEALASAFSGGMSTAGLATLAKQDEMITAIQGISGGSASRWPGYELARQDLDSDPIYFGYENADGDWYIKRMGFTLQTTMYFEGTGGIATSTNWSDRAGHSYVEFNNL